MIRKIEFKPSSTDTNTILDIKKHLEIRAISIGFNNISQKTTLSSPSSNIYDHYFVLYRNDEPVIILPYYYSFTFIANNGTFLLSAEQTLYLLREPIYLSSRDIHRLTLKAINSIGVVNDENHYSFVIYGDWVDNIPSDYENNYLHAIVLDDNIIKAIDSDTEIRLLYYFPSIVRIRRLFVNYANKKSIDGQDYYYAYVRRITSPTTITAAYWFELISLKAFLKNKSKALILSDDSVNKIIVPNYSFLSTSSISRLSNYYSDLNELAYYLEFRLKINQISNISSFKILTINHINSIAPIVIQFKKEVDYGGAKEKRKKKERS